MNRIKILSENLCNKIAAGEVVERPASVVKELVENCLDAGADEILVDVEAGGKKLIRVVDNGCGMSRDDTFLSIERHATSKIATDSDLFNLTTLGFRGEALPSIASVSRLSLQSRDPGSEAGWHIRANGGAIESAEAIGMPIGTTIEVRNLFFNTPARRKFLRSEQTEIGHIGDVISRQALARPEVRFRLNHNGRTLIDALKADQLEGRAAAILGRETLREMTPIMQEVENFALHGLLSRPSCSRSATTAIYTYINGRYIRDRVVQHAVMEGYRNLLMKGRYPVVVLFLDLPPDMVDVNVHPTKHEVRFREQSQVHDFIAAAIRAALRPAVSVAEGVPRFDIPSPISVADDHPVRPDAAGGHPAYENDSSVRENVAGYQPLVPAVPVMSRGGLPEQSPFRLPEPTQAAGPAGSMQVIGQFRDSYILCQDGDTLVLVDQHAAHERVSFERLRAQFYGEGVLRQSLLFPIVVDFDFREAAVLAQRLERFEHLGFELEPFGGNSFALKAVPQLLKDSEAESLVRDVASELAELGESARLEDAFDHLLATMACHSVIRANQRLSREEMQSLLREIDSVDFNAHCPHGRPVMQRLTLADIERLFKRV